MSAAIDQFKFIINPKFHTQTDYQEYFNFEAEFKDELIALMRD